MTPDQIVPQDAIEIDGEVVVGPSVLDLFPEDDEGIETPVD